MESNTSLHKSLSELVTAKLEAPQLSIRAAKKWGILDLYKKKVYGAKIIKNYIVGCYELLQDVLLTVDRYKGLNFISDFRIINHMIEARKAGVKVIPRLNSNFVVTRLGAEFRNLELLSFYLLWKTPPKFVFSVVEPLKCMLDNIESGRLKCR